VGTCGGTRESAGESRPAEKDDDGRGNRPRGAGDELSPCMPVSWPGSTATATGMSGAAAPALRPVAHVVSAKPDSVVRRDGGGSRRSPWRGTTLPSCQVNPASSKPNPGPGHRDNCGTGRSPLPGTPSGAARALPGAVAPASRPVARAGCTGETRLPTTPQPSSRPVVHALPPEPDSVRQDGGGDGAPPTPWPVAPVSAEPVPACRDNDCTGRTALPGTPSGAAAPASRPVAHVSARSGCTGEPRLRTTPQPSSRPVAHAVPAKPDSVRQDGGGARTTPPPWSVAPVSTEPDPASRDTDGTGRPPLPGKPGGATPLPLSRSVATKPDAARHGDGRNRYPLAGTSWATPPVPRAAAPFAAESGRGGVRWWGCCRSSTGGKSRGGASGGTPGLALQQQWKMQQPWQLLLAHKSWIDTSGQGGGHGNGGQFPIVLQCSLASNGAGLFMSNSASACRRIEHTESYYVGVGVGVLDTTNNLAYLICLRHGCPSLSRASLTLTLS
jgi:hypothetical protein